MPHKFHPWNQPTNQAQIKEEAEVHKWTDTMGGRRSRSSHALAREKCNCNWKVHASVCHVGNRSEATTGVRSLPGSRSSFMARPPRSPPPMHRSHSFCLPAFPLVSSCKSSSHNVHVHQAKKKWQSPAVPTGGSSWHPIVSRFPSHGLTCTSQQESIINAYGLHSLFPPPSMLLLQKGSTDGDVRKGREELYLTAGRGHCFVRVLSLGQ